MSPIGKLFGKRTVGAVAEIFETKVLVYLQEGLVLPGVLKVWLGESEGTEKALAAAFHFLVGSSGAYLSVGIPVVDLEWVERVDEEFGEAGFADELDGVFCLGGLESVMPVPEGVAEVTHRSGEFGKGWILLGECAEGLPLGPRRWRGRRRGDGGWLAGAGRASAPGWSSVSRGIRIGHDVSTSGSRGLRAIPGILVGRFRGESGTESRRCRR